DELACLTARETEAQPVHDVVEARLQQLQERLARHPFAAHGLIEVVAELPLHQPIDPLQLLLLTELNPELLQLALPLPMLTRRVLSALNRAFARIAPLALQEQFHTVPPAESADGTDIDRHLVDLLL